MLRVVSIVGAVCVALVALSGCAAGSATAGYSLSAGSADDLKASTRARIVEEAEARARAYTDERVAALRDELKR